MQNGPTRATLLCALLAQLACGGARNGADRGRRPDTPAIDASSARPTAVARSSTLPPLVTSTKARVILTVDKPSFYLGENVLVHYCLENITTAPITIGVGGDYRFASRSVRFRVTMFDARGAALADPDPNPHVEGGLAHSPQIGPGESWCQSLPVMRYARIDAPGTYTVRAVHDLTPIFRDIPSEWPPGTAPEGEVTVTFVAPSAAEAEGVIRDMEASNGRGASSGEKSAPYADFSCLRYAIYLAPLITRAAGGSVAAVRGIREIPTPEATRALLALLASPHADVVTAAAQALAMRLPDPALGSDAAALGRRNPFDDELAEQRRYLIAAGWRPELSDDVRAAATTLLASRAFQEVQSGAFMLEAVGKPEDAPLVLRALTTAAENPTERDVGARHLRRCEACLELTRAIEVLVVRGLAAPPQPRTAGEVMLFLVASTRAGTLGSKAAEPMLARALTHPTSFVRREAMKRAPKPLAPAMVPAVRNSLLSDDVEVQTGAMSLAADQSLTALAPDLLGLVRKTHDNDVLDGAVRAAQALGVRVACVDVLIDRLTDTDVGQEALGHLVDLLGGFGRSGALFTAPQAHALQASWRAFAKLHRVDIQAGRDIGLDDNTPTTLVPDGYIVHRENAPNWPPGR